MVNVSARLGHSRIPILCFTHRTSKDTFKCVSSNVGVIVADSIWNSPELCFSS